MGKQQLFWVAARPCVAFDVILTVPLKTEILHTMSGKSQSQITNNTFLLLLLFGCWPCVAFVAGNKICCSRLIFLFPENAFSCRKVACCCSCCSLFNKRQRAIHVTVAYRFPFPVALPASGFDRELCNILCDALCYGLGSIHIILISIQFDLQQTQWGKTLTLTKKVLTLEFLQCQYMLS